MLLVVIHLVTPLVVEDAHLLVHQAALLDVLMLVLMVVVPAVQDNVLVHALVQ